MLGAEIPFPHILVRMRYISVILCHRCITFAGTGRQHRVLEDMVQLFTDYSQTTNEDYGEQFPLTVRPTTHWGREFKTRLTVYGEGMQEFGAYDQPRFNSHSCGEHG